MNCVAMDMHYGTTWSDFVQDVINACSYEEMFQRFLPENGGGTINTLNQGSQI